MRLANGKVKKYNGFKEEALKKLQEYMSNTHDKEIKETELRWFLYFKIYDFSFTGFLETELRGGVAIAYNDPLVTGNLAALKLF